MRRKGKHGWAGVGMPRRWLTLAAGVVLCALPVAAQTVPGAADVGRIDKQQGLGQPPAQSVSPTPAPTRTLPAASAPAASKQLRVHLREVRLDGMTAFARADMDDLFVPYLDHEVTMDVAWQLAGAMTERYHRAGYFLSRVTVPEQTIDKGVLRLQVIEGYVGEIRGAEELSKHRVGREWLARLQSYRPLKSAQIESVLLELNDLPGISLRAVLEPLPQAAQTPGAVRLVLEPVAQSKVAGQVRVDNSGSRFLGPYTAVTQLEASLLPLQKTSLTLLASLPWDELKYGSLQQTIPVMAGGNLTLYGARTAATPGYTLKQYEIDSVSTLLGTAFDYHLLRQRQENLTGRVAFEARETTSDIFGSPLTRENVRTVRAGVTYAVSDAWSGVNAVSSTVSQGIAALGASKARAPHLSRAEAKPDFTKVEISLKRTQPLTEHWNLNLSLAGQTASGPLYSAEEFGYGGQEYGRAYDTSELTGDHGIAGSAEVNYSGIGTMGGFSLYPFVYYDAGTVWNDDRNQLAKASGSSAGMGMRVRHERGLTAQAGLAFPLSRAATDPIYTHNGKAPRLGLGMSYAF